MVDKVPTDQRAADVQKCQVHIRAPLVADAQTAVTVEPRECALHNPAMPPNRSVLLMPRRAMPRLRNPFAQRLGVISFVGVRLRGALARSAATAFDGRDGVHRL